MLAADDSWLWESIFILAYFFWYSEDLVFLWMVTTAAAYVRRLDAYDVALLFLPKMRLLGSKSVFCMLFCVVFSAPVDQQYGILRYFAFSGEDNRLIERVNGYAVSCWT